MAKKWTEEDGKFLKNNFKKMSDEELAKKFDVSSRAIASKLRVLGLKREKIKKGDKTRRAAKPKRKKQRAVRSIVHDNIRCRQCLIVDGYTTREKTCRHCGAKLFRGDVL